MKVKPQFGMEVGVSGNGYLLITQTRPGENEEMVLLSLSEALALKTALEKMAGGDWWNQFEDDGSDHE